MQKVHESSIARNETKKRTIQHDDDDDDYYGDNKMRANERERVREKE